MSALPDPHGFHAIVQEWPEDSGRPLCRGFTNLPLTRATRILVASDTQAQPARSAVVDGLRTALARIGYEAPCSGPGGLGCWATGEPAARNVLLFVAGALEPSPAAERFVQEWIARGFETLAMVRAGTNPDVALPMPLRRLNALLWRHHPHELLGDVLDGILLDGEDRRVFISYARADGSALAERVFELLERRRFEVFLDRFRLPPGSDFLERIQDEILDKSMVVVIETPQALRSTWVSQEVSIATARRLGLAAVNGHAGSTINEIDERARCHSNDDEEIARFLVYQHRTQLVSRRESMRASVHQALRHAGLAPSAITELPDGYVIDAPGGRRALAVSVRPADLRRFRRASEHANGLERFLVHPRPRGESLRRDLSWLSGVSAVVEVDEGRITEAAAAIAR